MPPGFRRSEATLQTTFEVDTPSEHGARSRADRDLDRLGDRARAARTSPTTLAEVEVALVQPGPLDARARPRRSPLHTDCEYCR